MVHEMSLEGETPSLDAREEGDAEGADVDAEPELIIKKIIVQTLFILQKERLRRNNLAF